MLYTILLILFLALLLFGGMLWPTRKLAELWHAERSGYGPAAVAVGATIVIGLLMQVYLAQMFAPLVLFIVGLALDTWIFSFLLGLSLLRGLLLTIIIDIVAAVLVVLLFLLLSVLGLGLGLNIGLDEFLGSDGISMFPDGEQQYNSTSSNTEANADSVCACGSDKACLQERYADFIIVVAQEMERDPESNAKDQLARAQHCVNSANHGDSTTQWNTTSETDPAFTGVEPPSGLHVHRGHWHTETSETGQTFTVTVDDGSTTPNSKADTIIPSATTTASLTPAETRVAPPITSITRPHKARWYFEQVPLASVDQYLQRQIRVTRADNGKLIQGRLIPSKRNSSIALEQRRYGGVFVMHIPKSQIRSLEIRNISQQ